MKHRLSYLSYGLRYRMRSLYPSWKKRFWKGRFNYCGRKGVTIPEGSAEFAARLTAGSPFSAGRFGFFELSAMRNFYFEKEQIYPLILDSLKKSAGVFPPVKETGFRFLELMKEALGDLDYLMCSAEPFENFFAAKYAKPELVWIPELELASPWLLEKPWTAALKGKRVLVVHPFEDTIQSQYKKRELIFGDTDLLPEFTLLTYRSMVTIGDFSDPRYPDFFSALEHQFEEISRLDFDVALLGCGAYGFPLAAWIGKRLNKTAVHMGGALQILFGILGARWDGSRFPGQGPVPELAPYVNDAWTYPSKEETPSAAGGVEYGPYWKSSILREMEEESGKEAAS